MTWVRRQSCVHRAKNTLDGLLTTIMLALLGWGWSESCCTPPEYFYVSLSLSLSIDFLSAPPGNTVIHLDKALARMRKYERMKLRAECNTDNPEHSPGAAAPTATSALTKGTAVNTPALQIRPNILLQVLLTVCPYQIQCNKFPYTINTLWFSSIETKQLANVWSETYCVACAYDGLWLLIMASDSLSRRNNPGFLQSSGCVSHLWQSLDIQTLQLWHVLQCGLIHSST